MVTMLTDVLTFVHSNQGQIRYLRVTVPRVYICGFISLYVILTSIL